MGDIFQNVDRHTLLVFFRAVFSNAAGDGLDKSLGSANAFGIKPALFRDGVIGA